MKLLFQLGVFLGLIGGIAVFVVLFSVSKTIPKLPQPLRVAIMPIQTEIFDRFDQKIKLHSEQTYARWDRIPRDFVQALVATEDSHFFDHRGIDKAGILRAVLRNVKEGRKAQGASTITQQLAKNLFYSFEKGWGRKLRDILTALQMESTYSKQEILEAYCNQVYFGSGAYGIEAASQIYFGKHARDLNLAESAMLAGLPNAPSRYNPYSNLDLAKKRQKHVLRRMVAVGAIVEDDLKKAVEFPITLKKKGAKANKFGYLIDYVLGQLEERFGRDTVRYGGIKVYTTVASRAQEAAHDALVKNLNLLEPRLKKRKQDILQSALVAIEPQTGHIVSMVGGKDYAASPYNRAVNPNRQIGSAFKPFIYLTAIKELGIDPGTLVKDAPITFKIKGSKDWTPHNYANKYSGDIILKWGLMLSKNVISARLIHKVTPEAVVKTVRKFGIKRKIVPRLSLALGATEVSPLEIASAYATFASDGVYRKPAVIRRVEDNSGNILYRSVDQSKRVWDDPQSLSLLLDMLQGVTRGGTARRIAKSGFIHPVAGKTGTTNSYKDAWFIGTMPDLAVAVWVGFDKPRPMITKRGRGVTGGMGALPVWMEFTSHYMKDRPVKQFSLSRDVVIKTLDRYTGIETTEDDPKGLKTAVRSGDRPILKVEEE